MDYRKFYKDILKVSAQAKRRKGEQGVKMQEMEEGIMKGIIEKAPEELKPHMESFMNSKGTQAEKFDKVFDTEGFDFVEFFEKFLNGVSDSPEPFSHQGVDIDFGEVKQRYEDSKEKFKKYEDSEDINNF
jgi:hypothetical protein